MSTFTFLFGSQCSFALSSKNLWFVIGPMCVLDVLALYVILTGMLISIQNEYEVVKVRRKLRRMLAWLALLVRTFNIKSKIQLLGYFVHRSRLVCPL
jgi:hypothetical protein